MPSREMFSTIIIIYLLALVTSTVTFSEVGWKQLCDCWSQDMPATVNGTVLSITINTSVCQTDAHIIELRQITFIFNINIKNSLGAYVGTFKSTTCYLSDSQCKRLINLDINLKSEERYAIKVYPLCEKCEACRPRLSDLIVIGLTNFRTPELEPPQTEPPKTPVENPSSDKELIFIICLGVLIVNICITALIGVLRFMCRPETASAYYNQHFMNNTVNSTLDVRSVAREGMLSRDAERQTSTEPLIANTDTSTINVNPVSRVYRNTEEQRTRHVFVINVTSREFKIMELFNSIDNEHINEHYFLDVMNKLNFLHEIETVWKMCDVIVTILSPDLCYIWNADHQSSDQIDKGLNLIKHLMCSMHQGKHLLFVNPHTETEHVTILKENQLQIPLEKVYKITSFNEQNEQYILFKEQLIT